MSSEERRSNELRFGQKGGGAGRTTSFSGPRGSLDLARLVDGEKEDIAQESAVAAEKAKRRVRPKSRSCAAGVSYLSCFAERCWRSPHGAACHYRLFAGYSFACRAVQHAGLIPRRIRYR